MKDFLKTNNEERPSYIILGILTFYLLVTGFGLYLFLLNRISFICLICIVIIFTLIYIPRFLIIYKIYKKDKIEIIDEYIMINGEGIAIRDIKDFKVAVLKPQAVFFINNKTVLFQQARFRLTLSHGEIEFGIIGTEKIKLLKEFLTKVVG